MAGRDSADLEARKVAGNLSPKLPWDLANPKWAASINPILSNPLVGGKILSNIVLATGSNVINHGLGKELQGWIPILNNANITIYDSQTTNSMPELTLVLVASGAATVSIYVF